MNCPVCNKESDGTAFCPKCALAKDENVLFVIKGAQLDIEASISGGYRGAHIVQRGSKSYVTMQPVDVFVTNKAIRVKVIMSTDRIVGDKIIFYSSKCAEGYRGMVKKYIEEHAPKPNEQTVLGSLKNFYFGGKPPDVWMPIRMGRCEVIEDSGTIAQEKGFLSKKFGVVFSAYAQQVKRPEFEAQKAKGGLRGKIVSMNYARGTDRGDYYEGNPIEMILEGKGSDEKAIADMHQLMKSGGKG